MDERSRPRGRAWRLLLFPPRSSTPAWNLVSSLAAVSPPHPTNSWRSGCLHPDSPGWICPESLSCPGPSCSPSTCSQDDLTKTQPLSPPLAPAPRGTPSLSLSAADSREGPGFLPTGAFCSVPWAHCSRGALSGRPDPTVHLGAQEISFPGSPIPARPSLSQHRGPCGRPPASPGPASSCVRSGSPACVAVTD